MADGGVVSDQSGVHTIVHGVMLKRFSRPEDLRIDHAKAPIAADSPSCGRADWPCSGLRSPGGNPFVRARPPRRLLWGEDSRAKTGAERAGKTHRHSVSHSYSSFSSSDSSLLHLRALSRLHCERRRLARAATRSSAALDDIARLAVSQSIVAGCAARLRSCA